MINLNLNLFEYNIYLFLGIVYDSSSPKLILSKEDKSGVAQESPKLTGGNNSVNHSPLIPRRADYEPVHRVTIQRQQRVQSPGIAPVKSPPLIVANSIVSHNMSDSGLSGTEDNSYGQTASSSDLTASEFIQCQQQQQKQRAAALNRPATLDLKASFINTSKQSEGISLSPTSTNEDEPEHFVMEDTIQNCTTNQNLDIQSFSPKLIKRKQSPANNNKNKLISGNSSPRSFQIQSQSESSNTLLSTNSDTTSDTTRLSCDHLTVKHHIHNNNNNHK